jgi:hypothetical protein
MPHGRVRDIIPASSREVFDMLHDYSRRMEWDTLLSEAYLTDGHRAAAVGAVSVCRGKRRLGAIAMKTQYVAFKPGEVAAVRMVNRPPLFDTFAATIRHGPCPAPRDAPPGSLESSWVEYTFTFTARPKFLRFLLHPIMGALFRRETRKRLRALRRHFSSVK